MIREQTAQSEYEFVSIEELVPQEHLLRKTDRTIDFGFIRKKVEDLYCADNGRPGVDPVVLFKILFIGYLYGIRSKRQLIREIEVNVSYRWFLGYRLRDKIPHHSTISQNRRRRFNGSGIYEEIFDEIVIQAVKHKMVDGKTLYTDSTHLKANANKNKFIKETVEKSRKDYFDELEKDINQDRLAHDKKPLKEQEEKVEVKEVKTSTTDPDSGYMVREGKPKGFFYLDHRTVDGKFNIVTDTFVTPASIHDSIVYLQRLDAQMEKFGFEVESVGLDAGYSTPGICKGLIEREIYGVIGYRRNNSKDGIFRKNKFTYDPFRDIYICPNNSYLEYRTTNRNGYREYASDCKICVECPFCKECTGSKNHVKVITLHIWQKYKEEVDRHRLEEKGKLIYKRRKETIERSFADAKELHGYRYARMRGINKVREQCFLTAACQNMKKIAKFISSRLLDSPKEGFSALINAFYALLFMNLARSSSMEGEQDRLFAC